MPRSGLSWRFEILLWESVYGLLLGVSERVRDDGFKSDTIVGVARGGLPVARILLDLLGNPEMATVAVEFYSGIAKTIDKPVITQPVSVSVKNKKVLVVDDVAETGRSLELIREHLKEHGATEVRIATIYYEPWSVMRPDWFERETRRWIVFPWELKETVRLVLDSAKEQGIPIKKAKQALTCHGYNIELLERFLKEIAEEES